MDLHAKTVARVAHAHDYCDISEKNESGTLKVVLLTGATMIIEIIAGHMTGSMALLADGWHMGTHAFALGISYAAYLLARRHRSSERFSFGTGKFGILAGYTSALFLGLAAAWMIYESIVRIFNPVHIAFNEAIWVTLLGFAVNLSSVFILHRSDARHRDPEKSRHHHETPGDHDHNFRAAYLHVIADTLTSIFALTALLSGRFLGWTFMDPVMGIAGGILIGRWAYGLIRTTGFILLDGGMDNAIKDKAKRLIEKDNESRVADLHVWRVGSKDLAMMASVVTGAERNAEEYQARLKDLPGLAHLIVEVHSCDDRDCSCSISSERRGV